MITINEVSKEVCDLHVRHYDTKLTQHEETIKQLTECTQKLTILISTQEDKQRDLDKRLKSIEKRPSVFFEKILVACITALVTVLVTVFLTGR